MNRNTAWAITEQLFELADEVCVMLPTRFYFAPEPQEIAAFIVAELKTSNDDWEEVYDKAVMEAEKWQTKYNQCLDQRNRAFRLLKFGLIHGVITSADQSALLRTMESLCGSDASNVEKSSPES